jgi:voltage-gated potassium channel
MALRSVLGVYWHDESIKRLFYAFFSVFIIVIFGTVSYGHLMDLKPLDAAYFTVITLLSIGYGDISPTSDSAKLFTIGFVVVGILVGVYSFSIIVSMFFEGNVIKILRREYEMEKILEKEGHIILCGYGDVGETLAEKINPVVIDKDEAKMNILRERGVLAFVGDSTRPETLVKAGIEKAKAIIIALDSDPDVLYTILTAKELNPKITVYARANHKESVHKMQRVGADKIICLPEIGANEFLKDLEEDKK